MVGGLVLYLAGTLTGIVVTVCGVVFTQYIAELKQAIKMLGEQMLTTSQCYDNLKGQITKEINHTNQKLNAIEKKIDELRPVDVPAPRPPDDIGNRSV